MMSAIGMLELENDSQLRKDVMAICDYLKNPSFRIAVFAPFNYGKSTLLNSLLGEKTLPIDLIPTTGAAIYVRYGEKLSTRIALQDGSKVAIPTGISWLLGGPVGAAVLGGASYILNKAATRSSESPIPKETTTKINSQVYADAAEAYPTIFSNEAFSKLNQSEKIVEKVIDFQPQEARLENTIAHHKLQLLNNLLNNLKQELESLDRNLSE